MTVRPIAMRDALLTRIWESMAVDKRIFLVTADFGSPVIDRVRADFPNRFINVGIAEQNLINISAGLALEGNVVFAYAIAPFITMRCYEQIRVSLALLSRLRRMNVNLIGVGAGYSYVVSGPTHQCYEDITVIRALPGLQLLSPADQVCAGAFFERCVEQDGPKYIRLDAQILPPIYQAHPTLAHGFHVHRRGRALCLVATGFMLHTAFKVADQLASEGTMVSVVDLFDLTGFDRDAMVELLSGHGGLVTLEEGFRGRGGLDALMFDLVARCGMRTPQLNIGVADGYGFDLGTREELHERVGIGPRAAAAAIRDFSLSLGSRGPSGRSSAMGKRA